MQTVSTVARPIYSRSRYALGNMTWGLSFYYSRGYPKVVLFLEKLGFKLSEEHESLRIIKDTNLLDSHGSDYHT